MKFLIIFGLFLLLGFFVIRAFRNMLAPRDNRDINTRHKDHSNSVDAKQMVECSSCGTFVDEKSAIHSLGKYYCCDKCLRK